MLRIFYTNGRQETLWKGDGNLRSRADRYHGLPDLVIATGDELDVIMQQCYNLPAMQRPHWHDESEHVTRWYGDHARFIVGNVKL